MKKTSRALLSCLLLLTLGTPLLCNATDNPNPGNDPDTQKQKQKLSDHLFNDADYQHLSQYSADDTVNPTEANDRGDT